ncbi:antiterminator Q family protein [Leclercia sp. UBA7405]|uniref:antiterminator Q family protein n=1 Tax=Leclercia sp. UBA7405 TaxID=1946743 RepID=UPI0020126DF3
MKAIKSNPIRPHSRKRNYTPAGFKRLFPHGKKYRLQYDDDEGILLDGCVTRLKKYNLEEYELIIAHFVIGISIRTIAKKKKCSDGTVRKQLQCATGFIDGLIYFLKE